jgi:hypothetical protein
MIWDRSTCRNELSLAKWCVGMCACSRDSYTTLQYDERASWVASLPTRRQ